MNRCDFCPYSRPIISENGYHSVCTLSIKKAMECMANEDKLYAIKLPVRRRRKKVAKYEKIK